LKTLEKKRKRIEELLRESEKRFLYIAENALEWIWEVDPKGKYTYASPVVEKILGYKPEEIFKKYFYDLFHPEDRKKLKKAAFAVFAKKKPFREFINRNVHRNGKIIWLSTSGVPIFDGKKNFLGYRGADIDITERKAIEQELRKQKRILEQKNIALGEIIQQIEVEKAKIKDDIATNVNELLLPILTKLKIKKATRKYVDLLQYHLTELTSTFGRKITEKSVKLTSREIEICSMVKGGLTSKEISSLLNISYQTVEKHRRNIRHKIGISNKDINLTSFLHTL